ncbi:MAG: family 43 glycosylhydrolase [Marvinbryantia sp.]|jgi:GH43 family beta-xylosidase
MEQKMYIKAYTREAVPGIYPDGLARSVHFASSRDGVQFEPLNQNYGMLFAKGCIREDNTICPKGVEHPGIKKITEGTYLIAAKRTEENGSAEKEQHVVCWETKDFLEFTEITFPQELSLDEFKDTAEVEPELYPEWMCRWGRIANVKMEVPEIVTVHSLEELQNVRVEAVYSDGSRAQKCVEWETDNLDFSKEQTVQVAGIVRQQKYPFPLARGFADPVLLQWEGKWYYISTNDNTDNVGIYVREADTIPELFAKDVKMHLILDYDEEKDFIQTFWAPEFHQIGGELYILLAIGGKVWAPQCHMMKLKKGGRIIDPNSWETPVRVCRKDGSPLAPNGISLDMTYLNVKSGSWLIWSYREHIGSALDTGSMLYIAKADETQPWRLAGEPVLLSRPLYGWENMEGTINNEGPYAFVKDGMVYLTYSGGAANGYSYALGLLTASEDADLSDLENWKKSTTAVMSYYSVDGEYGPGHNSFFRDEEGNLMIAYHGVEAIDAHIRCTGIRRVHFDRTGRPVFNLSEERDVNPELRNVFMQVNICK